MKHQQGFTIVELMVAIFITTLITIVITDYMMQNTRSSIITSSQQNILREIEQSLDEVATDIRVSANADTNNRNADPNAPTNGDQYSWASNANTLVLAKAAQTPGGNIMFSDPQHYVTHKDNLIYFVKNGTLYRRRVAAPVAGNGNPTTCPVNLANSSCPKDRELLHNVTNWQVEYLDGNNATVAPTNARSVRPTLSAAEEKYGKLQSASSTTWMVFRND